MKKIFLISFLFLACENSYDCTKADNEKLFEYLKWCQTQTGLHPKICFDQAKQLYCKEHEDKTDFMIPFPL